jgi:ketosteroid isomerase-like protein
MKTDRTTKALLALIALGLGAWACTAAESPQQQLDSTADEVAINEIRAQFASNLNSGDAEALMSLFDQEGVVMGTRQGLTGDALRRSFQYYLDEFESDITFSPDEVRVAGDWAFDSGYYMDSMIEKSTGNTIQESGGYVFVLKRQPNESWLIAREIHSAETLP